MDQSLFAHLLHAPQSEHLTMLNNALSDFVTVTTGDDIPETTQVLVAGRPTRQQLEALPDLRAILIPYVGLAVETRDLLLEPEFRHIGVYNSHHNAPMTTEMALALLFSTARHLIPIDRALRQGDWRPRYAGAPAMILDGKTALILGYGTIGRRVADVLRAVGMKIFAIKRQVPADAPDFLHPPDDLHDLLPQTQVLIICLPGTPQTEGLIGKQELALMPPGGILVNVGRGSVVDQYALYHALKNGHLFGAGLDVWWNYPENEEARAHTSPADVPLHELDNVVMSPHRSGAFNTNEAEIRRMRFIAESLNLFAETGQMSHRVDLEQGY